MLSQVSMYILKLSAIRLPYYFLLKSIEISLCSTRTFGDSLKYYLLFFLGNLVGDPLGDLPLGYPLGSLLSLLGFFKPFDDLTVMCIRLTRFK